MVSYSGGSEFLVNTAMRGTQFEPTITSLTSGGFVVSWADGSGQGSDLSSFGIKAQIFDHSGAKVGSEFLVNTETIGDQMSPTLASLSSGGFVISWLSGGINAQIFDASGAKVGSEFLVNTGPAGFQGAPTITSLSSGGFVVSWADSSGQGGPGIKAQIFDTTGGKVGSEFLVNTGPVSFQGVPTIASLSAGGFVVSWQDGSGLGGDSDLGIKAQIFDGSGAKVGSEFLANTETLNGQFQPDVTSLSSGGFVISWEDGSGQGGDADRSIKAQIFDAAGARVGSEFLVNTKTLSAQWLPTITSLSSGGFVVSWQDGSGQGGDLHWSGIKAQTFDASGAKIGSEFLVNTATASFQGTPKIASLSSGGFVVSWEDDSRQGGDAEGLGIKARIFTLFDELNRIPGTTGNDTLTGTNGPDLVRSLAGDDVLLGNGGDDELHGGQGSDTLLGHEGDDDLYGGGGNDVLFGGIGNDLLDGHAGDDQLIDLFGDNVFDTGLGNDLVMAGGGDDEFLFFAKQRGDDTVHGFGNGNDLIRLIGTSFADFGDVLAAGQDTAAGWRLEIDNDTSLTLFGIVETQLAASDFVFG